MQIELLALVMIYWCVTWSGEKEMLNFNKQMETDDDVYCCIRKGYANLRNAGQKNKNKNEKIWFEMTVEEGRT